MVLAGTDAQLNPLDWSSWFTTVCQLMSEDDSFETELINPLVAFTTPLRDDESVVDPPTVKLRDPKSRLVVAPVYGTYPVNEPDVMYPLSFVH